MNQIEDKLGLYEGGYVQLRCGANVGPLTLDDSEDEARWYVKGVPNLSWDAGGKIESYGDEHKRDIVLAYSYDPFDPDRDSKPSFSKDSRFTPNQMQALMQQFERLTRAGLQF